MSFVAWNIITLLTIGAAMCGVLLVRRYLNKEMLKSNHQVTDPLMATVGMLFAILLGFLVANAMTRYEECRLNVQAESGAVGDIFRIARGFNSSIRLPIMNNCLKYIDSVSNDEWPALSLEKMNDQSWNIYSDIWSEISLMQPDTQGQSNLHQALVGAVTKLGECRRARAAQIQSHMPAILWLVIYAGAFITVCFSFFFGLESVKLQLMMTALLTYVLCMNMYLLVSFNAPFAGDVKIQPTAFGVNQKLFRQILNKDVQ